MPGLHVQGATICIIRDVFWWLQSPFIRTHHYGSGLAMLPWFILSESDTVSLQLSNPGPTRAWYPCLKRILLAVALWVLQAPLAQSVIGLLDDMPAITPPLYFIISEHTLHNCETGSGNIIYNLNNNITFNGPCTTVAWNLTLKPARCQIRLTSTMPRDETKEVWWYLNPSQTAKSNCPLQPIIINICDISKIRVHELTIHLH